uniref:FMRFamide-related neuropeptide n=1 Tax=Angiostrongylus cantonensis TaxID=6313 RepID=A0A0K0D0U2_ANGCA
MLSPVSRTAYFMALLIAYTLAQDDYIPEKRAMRNALVRFGRAGGGMRNALIRFGKRSSVDDDYDQRKRNGAPQPFVRFGRSSQLDHMHDILSTLQKLEMANYY